MCNSTVIQLRLCSAVLRLRCGSWRPGGQRCPAWSGFCVVTSLKNNKMLTSSHAGVFPRCSGDTRQPCCSSGSKLSCPLLLFSGDNSRSLDFFSKLAMSAMRWSTRAWHFLFSTKFAYLALPRHARYPTIHLIPQPPST